MNTKLTWIGSRRLIAVFTGLIFILVHVLYFKTFLDIRGELEKPPSPHQYRLNSRCVDTLSTQYYVLCDKLLRPLSKSNLINQIINQTTSGLAYPGKGYFTFDNPKSTSLSRNVGGKYLLSPN
jgi:hypothetical protein